MSALLTPSEEQRRATQAATEAGRGTDREQLRALELRWAVTTHGRWYVKAVSSGVWMVHGEGGAMVCTTHHLPNAQAISLMERDIHTLLERTRLLEGQLREALDLATQLAGQVGM